MLKSAPLAGVRVLDMTRVLAGPFAAMLLADLGAEVIKVEKPGSGDDTRSWGPPFCKTESSYFLSVNRNKKSIAVNMKSKEGSSLLIELSKKCDVLLENYLPGKLDKFGLGYDSLSKLNPSLIYCSITGYGPGGPYDQRPGYDVVVSAMGGLMHITGPEDGDPCKVGVAMTDLCTGLYAHGAIMAALIQREKTKIGQKIDCSLLSSQIAVLSHIATSYLNTGFVTGRYGTAHHSIVPYQVFPTKDGHIMVGAGNDGLFKKLCKVIEMPRLTEDPKYKTNNARVQYRHELIPILADKLTERESNEWLPLLEEYGIPSAPINNIKQVFADPQVQYKNLVQEVDHPTIGNVKLPAPAVEYDGVTRLVTPSAPPLLGQHTTEVLRDILGCDQSLIKSLHQSGTVQSYKESNS
ncbi:predicted protein [Nematostella vectensis]|uniref:Succinate--hydroxymethylglutarate CoA-transferase n=2 Tax=Nematostella vectensis TaxID=45351 RepID=A7RHH7_NEMVE|nr:predicted protein [Nematostella vectensis]|eukprot:XP_001641048.1 predicted protein [Nematostella vectensis]